jgi:hypothetical protein
MTEFVLATPRPSGGAFRMFAANKISRAWRTSAETAELKRNQPSLSIFSRAALAKNAERVSPRAAAASFGPKVLPMSPE